MTIYLLWAILTLNVFSVLYFIRVQMKEKKVKAQLEDNKIIIEVGDVPLQTYLEQMQAALSSQMKEDLHSYIHFEEKEQEKWEKLIAETQDSDLKKVFVEAAFYRHPNNVTFFNFFYELLMEDYHQSSRNIKKIIIGKAQQLTQYFMNHCAVKDIEYAYEKEQEILKLSTQYMEDVVTHEKDKLEKQLTQLETLVSNKEPLEKIQQFDATINKAVLENNEDASEKYNELLQKITDEIIQEPSEQQIVDYNKRAISQAQEAEQMIFDHTKPLQKAKAEGLQLLPELAYKLGGWEDYYLTNSTQVYVNAVYSQLFGLLAPEFKPKLTTLMLSSPKKEIFS